MRRPLPHTEPSRLGVFTSAEAARAGWTRSALQAAVAGQRLIHLRRGVYADSAEWATTGPAADRHRLLMRTVAVLLTVRPAVASHTSSALLAGLPVWQLPADPCVTVLPRYTGDAERAHLHRAGFTTDHVVGDAPLPRTRTSRTVLDIAREHGTEDALVVGDCALARRMVSGAQLRADAEFCTGWPGSRRMARVLGLLDGRSESPLESVSRLRLLRAGLPVPDLQPDILTLGGRFLGRVDFYWDEFGVVGEVDGRVKYVDDPLATMLSEKRRQDAMEELGLLFTRWGRGDLENMPLLASRLRSVFARGARRPRSDRAFLVVPTASPTSFAPLMHAM